MRNVILKIHISLDGYIRGAADDNLDWVFRTYDDELKAGLHGRINTAVQDDWHLV